MFKLNPVGINLSEARQNISEKLKCEQICLLLLCAGIVSNLYRIDKRL